ncbi:MAG: cytidylate kinase-like family protein [Treponema sp.]|nr:cytidylate kinase-like family protein [Treponema sp.]MBQ7165702.1 cytidylate kinase-like family protein [Treponema sp.]
MKKIITISREYGSGGRSIGKKVADRLGISFYDSEIIDMAAETSGLSKEFISRTEQSISSGLLYTLLLGTSYATPGTTGLHAGTRASMSIPLADQVFNAQRQVVIDLAKKGPCVIVGRCSDYILTHTEEINKDDVLNVFIYAPLEFKAKRAVELKGLDEANAWKDVKLIDKRRANHYNTFTEQTWGDRKYYHALLNSSLFGIDGTADIIVNLVQHT